MRAGFVSKLLAKIDKYLLNLPLQLLKLENKIALILKGRENS
jgi:hypothetical protein